ncbi:MAG: winged helix-turn-helix domain-containing protein [Nitrososphaeria archaeon]
MEELRKMLKIYSVLDNDYRLNILFTIANEPDISFNDIARKTGIEKGLLAYHLGVLKNVGLVEMEYSKRSKKLTKYKLTDEGKKIFEKLKLTEKPAEV